MIGKGRQQHNDLVQEAPRDGEESAGTPEAVHLLDDSPLSEDKFEGQAHEAVAKAIAKLICDEPGGRVIGLEGPWGSGKSTVVKLLTAHLQSSSAPSRSADKADENRVSVFDAWAHQGDPLRRTFLETLIADLKQWEWLTTEEADDANKPLTGKTWKAHTTTTPHLTRAGQITSASALLVPLGVALGAAHFSEYPNPLFYMGLLLSLAPIITITGLWLWSLVRRHVLKRKTGPLKFFAEERETETTSESVESSEPTSVEFEAFFKNILGKAMKERRRLLVVLDNLDRVRQEDALAIFATMQTFTSSSIRNQADPWRQRVWTLIPYDREGLDSLWAWTVGEESGESTPESVAVSTAFLEKVFEIRFITPPLVVSNWHDYLFDLLRESLPDRDDLELRRVVRLRGAYPEASRGRVVAREQPTPRQLKQFVNSMGAVLRQRRDIPLLDVAYFCLMERDRIDVGSALLAGSLPHKRLAFMFTGQTSENLAALVYGTPAALGGQLLLRGPIDEALRTSDSNAIRALSGKPGFTDAIERLDVPSLAADGGVELTRRVSVLADSGVLVMDSLLSWVQDCLTPQARSAETRWQLTGTETGRGLAFMCSLLPEEKDQADLLGRILPIDGNDEKNALPGLEALGALASALDDRMGPVRGARVTLEVPEGNLVASLAYYRRHVSDVAAMSVLQLTIDPARVSELVVSGLVSENPEEAVQAFEVLAARPDRFNQDAILDNCYKWLSEQDAANAEQLEAVLQMIDRLRSASNLARLQRAADDGTLMNHMAEAHTHGWMAAAASASMLFLVARDCTIEPQAIRKAAIGVGLLRQALHDPPSQQPLVDSQRDWLGEHRSEAVELFMRQESADGLIGPWVDFEVSALYRAAALYVSPGQLATYFQSLERGLEPSEFEELIGRGIRSSGDRRIVTTQSHDPVLALYAVKSLAQTHSTRASTDILAWGATIVQETPRDTWSSALAARDTAPVIELALALVERGQTPEVGSDLDEAVREHADRLEAGQEGWEPSGADFMRLASMLSSAAQKTLASQLISGLEGRDGEVAGVFFGVYGDFLDSQKQARTHEKLPGVVARLVANDQWDAVDWFVGLAKAHKDVLNRKGREDAFAYLDERVGDRVESYGVDPKPPALMALESTLGLSPQQKGE